MPMNFGSLNARCTIFKPIITRDAVYGSEITKWKAVATVYCGITDILPRNDENVSEKGIQISPQRSKIRFRYSSVLSDVDSSYRLIIARNGVKRCYMFVSEGAELGMHDGIEYQIERMSGESIKDMMSCQ